MTRSDRPRRPGRGPLLAAAAGVWLGLPSCSGGPARPPLYPVHGSVTVAGKPAARAVVVLRPVAGPQADLPHAEVGDDGRFRIGTYGESDGAPAGDYAVTVTWPAVTRDPRTGDELVEDRLRGRFDVPEKSPLKVTVRSGDNPLAPIHLD